MQIRFLFAMTCYVMVFHLNAQQINIPPSPNASSLGNYAEVDQIGFTGEQNVLVPITELKVDQSFVVPVSLSYKTGGIKVEQIASNVGLGWALNAGGVVTRVVQGYPDDIGNSNFKGYFKNLAIVKNFDQNDPVSTITSTLNDASNNDKDLEPDVFYFNFFGKTGKFLFDEDKQIQQISHTNYQIVSLFDGNEEIIGFVITDDAGNKYRFEEVETSEVSNVYDERSPMFEDADKANYSFNSSWYLTKIITALDKEVDFQYTQNTINYRKRPVVIGRVCKNNDCVTYPYIDPNWSAPEYINYEVDELCISKISFGKRFIQFNYSNNRQDLQNGMVLSSIEKSQDETVNAFDFSDQWSLTHSYFNSTGGSSEIYKRLKLTGITRLSRDLLEIEDVYSFEYESQILPHRESFEQDFWGFYNGNGANDLIPEIYAYPSLAGTFQEYSIYPISGVTNYHLFPGADRTPNSSYTGAGALKKIIYPTKGSQEFVFENNEFLFNGQVKKGPGLRVKKIIKSDEEDHSKDMTYEYSYDSPQTSTSSGKAFGLPHFAVNTGQSKVGYLENSEIKIEDGSRKCRVYAEWYTPCPGCPAAFTAGCSDEGAVSWTNYYKYFYKTERFAIDQSALSGLNNIHYGYEFITKTFPDGGNEVAQYNVEGSIDDWPNYTSGTYSSKGDFYIPEIYSIDGGVKTKTFNHSYPFPINSNFDWKRGSPVKIESFDDQGNLVKEISYSYSINDFGNDVICILNRPLKAFDPEMKALRVFFQNSASSYILKENRFALYRVLANLSYDVTSVVTNHHNGSSIISNVQQITYEPGLLYPREVAATGSEGKTLSTKYYYPSDFLSHNITLDDDTDSESSGIDRLIEKNILSVPVEQFSLIDGKVVSAELTTFRTSSNNAVLDKTFNLPVSSPITWSNNLVSNITRVDIGGNDHDYSFHKNSNYEVKEVFDDYDNKGNVLQMHKSSAQNTSIIWGYNQSKPVANIQNAKSNEVFYAGFEDEKWSSNLYLNHSDKYTGLYSLKVAPTKFGFSEEIDVEDENGKYVLSAMIKTSTTFSNGGNANLVIQVIDENNGSQIAWLPALVGTTFNEWVLFSREVDLSLYSSDVKLKLEIWNSNNQEYLVIDDVRFHPKDALMSTYTYEERSGITSITDTRREVEHFEYDNFGRLLYVKDIDGNILSSNEYNYKP